MVLGIKFSKNLKEMVNINFEDKLQEIEKTIRIWSKRYLTVPGRITVVKTILLSKLTHLFISLPTPDCHTIKNLEKLLFKFIWGSGKDRVARYQLIQDYCLQLV